MIITYGIDREVLASLLRAYAALDASVGYCQGNQIHGAHGGLAHE